MSARFSTAMSIVAEVNRLLESEGGRRKLHRLGLIAVKLNSQADKIRSFLKLARGRRTANFYLNASQTYGSHVRLSVRVGGVQCGSLLLKDRTSRHFRPLNAKRFGLLHDAPQPDVQWEHSSVRRFLEGAADAISADTGRELARRESLVDAELLSQMKGRNSRDRADSLMLHQPVLYPLKGGL